SGWRGRARSAGRAGTTRSRTQVGDLSTWRAGRDRAGQRASGKPRGQGRGPSPRPCIACHSPARTDLDVLLLGGLRRRGGTPTGTRPSHLRQRRHSLERHGPGPDGARGTPGLDGGPTAGGSGREGQGGKGWLGGPILSLRGRRRGRRRSLLGRRGSLRLLPLRCWGARTPGDPTASD